MGGSQNTKHRMILPASRLKSPHAIPECVSTQLTGKPLGLLRPTRAVTERLREPLHF